MSVVDNYREELIPYQREPKHWVLIGRQGVHWDDFCRMAGGKLCEKERFFRSLPPGQAFDSKQQLIDTYTAWVKAIDK